MSSSNTSTTSRALLLRLKKDLVNLQDGTYTGILAVPSEDNTQHWDIYLEGPADTCYEKGIFHLEMIFPDDYPQNPPSLRFLSQFWHPNVFPDGKVCISILHPSEQDPTNPLELLEEKWRPIHNVGSILLSVQSMLSDPNVDSIANVDPYAQWRDDRDGFNRKAEELSTKAFSEVPPNIKKDFYNAGEGPKKIKFEELDIHTTDLQNSGGFDWTIPENYEEDDDWGDADPKAGEEAWGEVAPSQSSSSVESHEIQKSSSFSTLSQQTTSRKRDQHPT